MESGSVYLVSPIAFFLIAWSNGFTKCIVSNCSIGVEDEIALAVEFDSDGSSSS